MSKGRKHSEATIALIRADRVARAEKDAAELTLGAERLMLLIEQEIAANDGVYPQNGGALSLAEFYRRLEVDESTIRKRHKTLRGKIDTWRKGLAPQAAITRTEARRSEAKRVADWKELYEDLLTTYRTQELDWQQAKADVNAADVKLQTALAQLADMQTRFDRLLEENQQLSTALEAATAGKVVSLRRAPAVPPIHQD